MMAEIHVFMSTWINSEPRMRYLNDGTAVCSFLGSSQQFYQKEGERHEGYEFVFWGKNAEWVNENYRKDDCVDLYSSSPVETRTWDKGGETQVRMSVRVDKSRWSSSGKKQQTAAPDSGELPF